MLRRVLVVAGVLMLSAGALSAQSTTCAPTCALRIQHGILGDKLYGTDGAVIGGRRLVTAEVVQRQVAGVPSAEAWARVHVRADRRARFWGAFASVSTLTLLIAQGNDLQNWKASDQSAIIWGTAVTGLVFGALADRQLRTSQDARGAALEAFNTARGLK
jgi:hypothetical protein